MTPQLQTPNDRDDDEVTLELDHRFALSTAERLARLETRQEAQEVANKERHGVMLEQVGRVAGELHTVRSGLDELREKVWKAAAVIAGSGVLGGAALELVKAVVG